jgi:hypothetical protein
MATIRPATAFPNDLSSVQTSYIEVSRQYNNGDGTGRYVTYKYRGSKNALRAASADWVRAGGKYQIDESGPYPEATVTFAGNLLDPDNPTKILDPTEEEPSQRYEFRTEYVDASLFELPQVRAEAKTNLDTDLYFSAIKLAAEDPKNNKLPLLESQFPLAHQLVKRLARGQTSFQTHRVSLTRISSYSSLNGLPATPPIISAVYDGPNIANLNGFPVSVRNAMPRPPSNPNLTPEGTAWSWLKTNDSTSLTIKTNQVERNETWTFAAWDLFAYPYNVDPRLLT